MRRPALAWIGLGVLAVGVSISAYPLWLFVGTDVIATKQYKSDVGQLRQGWLGSDPKSGQKHVVVSEKTLGTKYAVITIPKIHLTAPIVQGIRVSDLRHGVGHYPGSADIGEAGNLAFAGHRTTYGHPFGDLDKLNPGNLIHIEAGGRIFTYEVTRSFVVTPDHTDVVGTKDLPQPDAELLTLTTCNPRYSARQRLIVRAIAVPRRVS